MSETDAALNAALAAAQAEFQPIVKDRTVTVTTRDQGKYSFSYATLDAILAACRPALNQHGLALVQLLVYEEGLPVIRTELRHGEGGVLGASFPLPNVPSSPQQLGSLLTYLRRYAISALLGVAAEEDDDAGQAAQAEPAKPRRQTKKPPSDTPVERPGDNSDAIPRSPATPETEQQPQASPTQRRAQALQRIREAIEQGDRDRRHLLPAGFDDWTDYARSLTRQRWATASLTDLTLEQVEQFAAALEDELIPF